MKEKRYIYPAVLSYHGEGKEIAVVFPDFDVATSGADDADALYSARECIGSRIALMEDLGEELPVASHLEQIKTNENERAILVDVFMPSFRLENQNKSVNRTVTLPAWLNAKALENNVNFSQVLQEALKSQLT